MSYCKPPEMSTFNIKEFFKFWLYVTDHPKLNDLK